MAGTLPGVPVSPPPPKGAADTAPDTAPDTGTDVTRWTGCASARVPPGTPAAPLRRPCGTTGMGAGLPDPGTVPEVPPTSVPPADEAIAPPAPGRTMEAMDTLRHPDHGDPS